MTKKPSGSAREHILTTAHKLIFERGFKGVSMGDVAAATGLKKANLFHYYPTKEALGLAVFDFAAGAFRDWIATTVPEGAGDPIAVVENMFDAAAASMQESGWCGGCFVGNVAQELSDHHEGIRLRVDDVFRFWADRLADVLARARGAGFFRPDFDPHAASDAILSLFEGSLLLSKARKDSRAIHSAKHMASDYLGVYKA
jgi:TetR/AcrR family transcriptional repressor of nem operon